MRLTWSSGYGFLGGGAMRSGGFGRHNLLTRRRSSCDRISNAYNGKGVTKRGSQVEVDRHSDE